MIRINMKLGGNKMIKLSKKQLKDLAISLNAYYCGGNVYTHENITHSISSRNFTQLLEYGNTKNDISKLINNLNKKYNINKLEHGNLYSINANQIAYSCGTYGDTGHTAEYVIVSRETNEVIY